MANSLLLLLDDMATLLDDVAILTKIAAKKTAGVLGDDLALNAEQVSGVRAERELPVVYQVFKGSLRNKLILVPLALIISAIAPPLVTILLVIGGAYLCFEGAEKVFHKLLTPEPDRDAHRQALTAALVDENVNIAEFERKKIQGAIRTDFILSAEIIVITLGTVAASPLTTQLAVLGAIALAMTLGVYGLVAAIVKIDDLGLYLHRQEGRLSQLVGRGLVVFAPYLMKTLAIVGTLAMFLVGGGILLHNWPAAETLIHHWSESAAAVEGIGAGLAWMLPVVANALVGLLIGGVLLAAVEAVMWVRRRD